VPLLEKSTVMGLIIFKLELPIYQVSVLGMKAEFFRVFKNF
jgi:hypothetical protein